MNIKVNFSEKVPSFLDMFNSESSDHEELTRPTQNSYFSHSLDEEEIVEAIPVSPQVFCTQKTKEKKNTNKKFYKTRRLNAYFSVAKYFT